ncbi:sugar ABC transporter permease [Aeromicrobium sp.]
MSDPTQPFSDKEDPTQAFADREDVRLVEDSSPKALLRGTVTKLKSGDLGMVPVIVGLIVIWIVFQTQNSRFLSSRNLVELSLDSATIGMISIGVVLVLLLGEIDLSVGSVSGLAGSTMAVLLVYHDWPVALAILAGLSAGLAIGTLYGLLYTRFGVPSFVITLSGLLAFLGLQLMVLGSNGTVNLPVNSSLIDFASFKFLSPTASYILAVIAGALYFIFRSWTIRQRVAANLSGPTVRSVAIRAVVLVFALACLAFYLNKDRGIGFMPLLWVLTVVLVDLILRKTSWGRHVFAVGGNEEAARRSGIAVNRVYLSVFALCSGFAALGGVLAAARLQSVAQTSGGADVNLMAIAAAVIGGTSLFGGRGSAYAALFGMLVLQSITSGLNLIGVEAEIRYMVTGAVLLLAVTIDSLSRRARSSSGRA